MFGHIYWDQSERAEPDVWGEGSTGPVLSSLLCWSPHAALFVIPPLLTHCVGGREGGRKPRGFCGNVGFVSPQLRRRSRERERAGAGAGGSSSPGPLSSSQDRSSELTSARLGVRLESSESEPASSAPTSPGCVSRSSDAPKSKVQMWRGGSIMLGKLGGGGVSYWMPVRDL